VGCTQFQIVQERKCLERGEEKMCRPGQRDVMGPRGITYNVKLILNPPRKPLPLLQPPFIYPELKLF
jgi:hypothetical protein